MTLSNTQLILGALVLLSLASFISADCIYKDSEFRGPYVNDGANNYLYSYNDCLTDCQLNPSCNYWAWYGPDFTGINAPKNTCWHMQDQGVVLVTEGVFSGDQLC